MKRLLILLVTLSCCLVSNAQKEKDFASKFMEQFEYDTAVNCITVSPKMMEQLTKNDLGKREHLAEAIQKLKSARIITATQDGEHYYQIAEELLKKNSKRFSHVDNYQDKKNHGSFYSRKDKTGKTVELILIHLDNKQNKLVVVNLTGDIDEEFIASLSKNFHNQN